MDPVWLKYFQYTPGDNYMLFDDYSVVAGENPTPRITSQPQSQSVVRRQPGNPGGGGHGERRRSITSGC